MENVWWLSSSDDSHGLYADNRLVIKIQAGLSLGEVLQELQPSDIVEFRSWLSQELSFALCGKKERYLLPYGSGRNLIFIVSFASQCIASNFFLLRNSG